MNKSGYNAILHRTFASQLLKQELQYRKSTMNYFSTL